MRQLVRDGVAQARELFRLEVALARNEMRSELARAKAGVIALVLATGAAVASCTLFLVAVALAFSGQVLATLFGLVLLLVAGGLGLLGYKRLPTKPMAETTVRISADVREIKERIQ